MNGVCVELLHSLKSFYDLFHKKVLISRRFIHVGKSQTFWVVEEKEEEEEDS